MRNTVQLIELALLLIGSVFAVWVGARDLAITMGETAPTVIDAAELSARDAEVQWLDVRGRLAIEHAGTRASTHETHVDQGLGYVHVPVVPEGWQPSAPVEVVATFGPVDITQALDWDELTGEGGGVTGLVRPAPLARLDELFPGLSFPAPPVVVNAGTEPKAPLPMLVFTIVMGLVALACAYVLLREWAERRRPAQGGDHSSS